MKPVDLDRQSPVKIDRWLDVDSEEFKRIDPDTWVTKQLLRRGLACDALMTDSDGRVWSNPIDPNDKRFPLNFTEGGITYGYRIPERAHN